MAKIQHYKEGKDKNKHVRSASFYQGPLPSPEMLHEYEKVVHGLGKDIVDEFKAQGRHRRIMEKLLLVGGMFVGPVLAFTVIGFALWLGYSLLVQGKQLEGFAVFLSPLAVLAGLFVWNNPRKKE